MYAYKEVCLCLVGYVGSSVQRYEHVGLAGEDNIHVRTVSLQIPAKGECRLQVDVFLFREGTYGTSVMPSMSRVNDKRKPLGVDIGNKGEYADY